MRKIFAVCLALALLLTGCGSSGGGSSPGSASLPDESAASGSSASVSSAADGSASQSTQDQTEATGPQRVEGISVTVDGMDGTYTGTVNEAGKPDGSGTFDVTWGDLKGSTYVGDFVDGSMEGTGSFEFMDGSSYTGGTHASNFLGKGYLTFSDGEKFYGDFIDNRNATGTYTDLDGIQWEAELKDGQVVQGKQLSAEAPDNSSQSGSSSTSEPVSSSGGQASGSAPENQQTIEELVEDCTDVLRGTYNAKGVYDAEAGEATFYIINSALSGMPQLVLGDDWTEETASNWETLKTTFKTLTESIGQVLNVRFPGTKTSIKLVSSLDTEPYMWVQDGEVMYDIAAIRSNF